MLRDPNEVRADLYNANPYCIINDTVFDHVTSGSWLNVTMATTTSDPWSMHDAVNTEFINIVVSGLYFVLGGSEFPANATGQRGVRVVLNASTAPASNLVDTAAAGVTVIQASALVALVSGDTIELEAFQNSGGTLSNLLSGLQAIRMNS